MKRKDFEALNDVSLIWTCIEPTIQQVRGKNFVVKSDVYAQLSTGQRALLMFQMLYGHTSNGVEEFYSHLSYLLLNKGVWLQLKNGMRYFGDYDMIQVLEKVELFFQRLKMEEFKDSEEPHNILAGFDKNAELSASMLLLNRSLRETLPSTTKRVATYIRENVNEFVQFID
jgi:uncharacterized protein YlzI (FlbEa/FlbD family)